MKTEEEIAKAEKEKLEKLEVFINHFHSYWAEGMIMYMYGPHALPLMLSFAFSITWLLSSSTLTANFIVCLGGKIAKNECNQI